MSRANLKQLRAELKLKTTALRDLATYVCACFDGDVCVGCIARSALAGLPPGYRPTRVLIRKPRAERVAKSEAVIPFPAPTVAAPTRPPTGQGPTLARGLAQGRTNPARDAAREAKRVRKGAHHGR